MASDLTYFARGDRSLWNISVYKILLIVKTFFTLKMIQLLGPTPNGLCLLFHAHSKSLFHNLGFKDVGSKYERILLLARRILVMRIRIIVFVWSQLDGGKVEQKNNGISSRQNLMMP